MIIETEIEYQADAGSTKATPGELSCVFCEYLWENWPRYNGIRLFVKWS